MAYKLGIVLSTQPASFSALAYKGRLAENLAKISEMGYDGVELAVRDPALIDLADLQRMLHQHHLPVPAIGTGQAFGEEGLSFTHPQAKIRRQAIARIQSHMALAEALDAVVIIGLIRGRLSAGVSADQARTWMSEALRACVRSHPRVKLAIEPLNRYETDILNTVAETLSFIDELKLDQVGLLLDSFHMNIEEPSVFRSIELAGNRIFHVHVADSNRWHPGAGHIDFIEFVRALDRSGYDQFISAEILPLPDSDSAARETITYMKEHVFAAT
ncbi:sugar phosphate isomerase/epimerase [candidate division KSB1 bacterium]|nr:sugar phosphate isomerase/epimerase [candidate division KSB1 bacterium]